MTNRFVNFNPKYATAGETDILDSQNFAQLIYSNYAANVWYVHSGTGADTNDGKRADYPFATIDAAIGAATANQGDVILVMPGHAEDIADATTFQVDVAGLTIIGLGHGRNRPTFTFTNTAGSIEIDSDNTVISNLVFISSITAVVVGMNVDADYCTIDGCEWNYDETGDDFILAMDIDAVTGTIVQNCYVRAEEAAGATAAIRLDAAPDTIIRNNRFIGRYTQTISGTTGSAAASTGIQLLNNLLENVLTSSGLVVDMHDSSTGLIAGNFLASGDSTTAVAGLLDPGNCKCFENYVCNAADETGGIVPGTASG